MSKKLLGILLFSIVYIVVGVFMENILRAKEPVIYASVYCMLGVVYGKLN